MNKEEILARARKEPDERDAIIDLKGFRYGTLCGVIIGIILMLFKMIANESWYDIYAIIGTICGVQTLYRYHFNIKKSDLIYGLCWIIISIIFIFAYITEIMK